MTGSSGPEYCSKAYAQSCTIDGLSPAVFCKRFLPSWHYYDFTRNTVDTTDPYLPICS
jgi:hypothetical protein